MPIPSVPPLKELPRSPQELQEVLLAVFPLFAAELSNEADDAAELREITFHRVVMDFAPFFSSGAEEWNERQLRWLGELVDASIAGGGRLGNAWDTCFMEHVRQLKVNRKLAPWLAKARAKRESR